MFVTEYLFPDFFIMFVFVCLTSLCGQRGSAAKSYMAVWGNDPVCSARSQPLYVQQLRLLVWPRGDGDPSGWSGHVGSMFLSCLVIILKKKNTRVTGFFSSCRCCEVHDKCYKASRKAPGCTAIADLPYVLVYDSTCSNQQVSCSGEMMLPRQVLSVFKLVVCGGILRRRCWELSQNAWCCSIYVTTAQTNAPAVLSLCIVFLSSSSCRSFPDSPVSPQPPITSARPLCASAIGWRLTASLRPHTTLKTRTWIPKSTVSTELYNPQKTHTHKLDFSQISFQSLISL